MAAYIVVFFALATLSLSHAQTPQCTDVTIGNSQGRQVQLQPIVLPPPDKYFEVTVQIYEACASPNAVFMHTCDPDGAAPTVTGVPPNKAIVSRNVDRPQHAATMNIIVFCP